MKKSLLVASLLAITLAACSKPEETAAPAAPAVETPAPAVTPAAPAADAAAPAPARETPCRPPPACTMQAAAGTSAWCVKAPRLDSVLPAALNAGYPERCSRPRTSSTHNSYRSFFTTDSSLLPDGSWGQLIGRSVPRDVSCCVEVYS